MSLGDPHIPVSQPQAASIISRKSQRRIQHRVSCNGVTKCDGNYRVSRKVVQVDLLRDTETETDTEQGNIHTWGDPGLWSLITVTHADTDRSMLHAGVCFNCSILSSHFTMNIEAKQHLQLVYWEIEMILIDCLETTWSGCVGWKGQSARGLW